MKKSVFYSYVKQWIHLALKFPVSSVFLDFKMFENVFRRHFLANLTG